MSILMKRQAFRKKVLLALFAISTLYLVIFSWKSSDKVCYFTNDFTNDGKTFKIINNSHIQSNGINNIFFHETSCSKTGSIILNPRQGCAIESAAKVNPSHQIYVFFTSQIGFRNSSPLPIIDALLSYNNVHFSYLNLTQYVQETPLDKWLQSGELFRSMFINSHTSDILRFLTLWKYGGTYLDLDVVVRKPVDSILPNYAGAESNTHVAVGIINLDRGYGLNIAEQCLNDLLINFNGQDWGNNGPGVLTRVLQNQCGTKNIEEMTSESCDGFTVLPITDCYSIKWPEHQKFFREQFLNETMMRINNSLIAHVWNKHSEIMHINKTSNVAYIQLAKEFCPKVLDASTDYF